jgi:hypothetical protein
MDSRDVKQTHALAKVVKNIKDLWLTVDIVEDISLLAPDLSPV